MVKFRFRVIIRRTAGGVVFRLAGGRRGDRVPAGLVRQDRGLCHKIEYE